MVLDVEVPDHDPGVLLQTELHGEVAHCTHLRAKKGGREGGKRWGSSQNIKLHIRTYITPVWNQGW